jgi:hypothetical protein
MIKVGANTKKNRQKGKPQDTMKIKHLFERERERERERENVNQKK